MLRVLAVGACLGALAGASCVAGTARAAFPGANGLIAFQVNATTSDGSFIEHIYVVEPEGTGLRDLSTVSAPDGLVLDANPAWSPDGTKIAFDSNRGGSGATHVFVMNANGTGVHQITGQPGSDPAWSPDGNRLAFVRDGNIFFRDLTTRLVRQLTHEVFPATAFGPTWSPVRPGLLAYASSGGSFGTLNIFTVRLSDLLTHQLTFDGRSTEPDFWPDGSRIVFSSTRDGASSDGSDLYLMRADGTRPRRLTAVGAFHEGVGEPAVSPDGTQVAFELGGPFASDLMNPIAIAPAGTPPLDSVSVMLSVGDFDIFPSWQPLH